MNPYFDDGQVTLYLGDCRDVLPVLPDASVDAVACDPPYEINFMGRGWDASGIAYDTAMWRECWRVLKPGGHLLAFGATRTYHRLAVAIEDAGFEIRDSIHWIYGNGFPKGQDIGKSIDRRRNDRADVLKVTAWLAAARDIAGWTNRGIDALWGFDGMASHWTTQGVAASLPTLEQWSTLRDALSFDDSEILPLVDALNVRKGTAGDAWEQRPAAQHERRPGMAESWTQGAGWKGTTARGGVAVLNEAQPWEGWNTALKPAHEPIVVARKSTGFNTIVANVLEHGTGAMNIDACRVSAGQDYRDKCASVVGLDSNRNGDTLGEWTGVHEDSAHNSGRWPTNVVLTHSPECEQVGEYTIAGDRRAGQANGTRAGGFLNIGSDNGDQRPNGTLHGQQTVPVYDCTPGCPVAEMNQQGGTTASTATRRGERRGAIYNAPTGPNTVRGHNDEGGASRFFPVFRYEPKAPTSERPRLDDGTVHTTVKPLDLMRWLVRLVTPPGGTVLDPFVGSGTTLEACIVEGFHGIGIEQHQPYADLCVKRLSKPIQAVLGFEEAAS